MMTAPPSQIATYARAITSTPRNPSRWSDVLTADAYQAFVEGKGPYDKEVAKRLRDNVFSVGNTIDPADGYRKFRGRDAKVDALMKDRGFPLK